MHRQQLLAVCLVALVALAGCAGGTGGNGETTSTTTDATTSTTADGGATTSTTTDDGATTDDGSGGSGTVATYMSDRPAAIDDFAHLNATVTRVGLHRVGADANASGGTNASADDANASGWQTVNVNETVDLTDLRGENATHIVNQTVPNGTYNNVFVYVEDVEGTLTDGSSAAVKLPSGKLHLSTRFTVETNETVDFVYDLAVHETGNGRYIIRPNAGESGPNQPMRVVSVAHTNASVNVDLDVSENDTANASSGVDVAVTETVSVDANETTNETATTTTGGASANVSASGAVTAGEA